MGQSITLLDYMTIKMKTSIGYSLPNELNDEINSTIVSDLLWSGSRVWNETKYWAGYQGGCTPCNGLYGVGPLISAFLFLAASFVGVVEVVVWDVILKPECSYALLFAQWYL